MVNSEQWTENSQQPTAISNQQSAISEQLLARACSKNQFCNKGTALAGPKNAGKSGALAPEGDNRNRYNHF
jgi:hypothetical protein